MVLSDVRAKGEEPPPILQRSLLARSERFRGAARAPTSTPVSQISPSALFECSVDSLIVIELKNWILKELGADFATFDIIDGLGIKSISRLVVVVG